MLIKRTFNNNFLKCARRLFSESKEIQTAESSQIMSKEDYDSLWFNNENIEKWTAIHIRQQRAFHLDKERVQINLDTINGLIPVVLAKPFKPKWILNDVLSLASVGGLLYFSTLGTLSYPVLGLFGLVSVALLRRSWIQNKIDNVPVLRQLWLRPNGEYWARIHSYTDVKEVDIKGSDINMNANAPKGFNCLYRSFGLNAILPTPPLQGRWVQIGGQKCILPNNCHINSNQINKI